MNEYKTSDLQAAAYLVTVGHRLKRIEGSPSRRVFVFDGRAEADVLAYLTDSIELPPRRLFASYRDLKSTLFATA